MFSIKKRIKKRLDFEISEWLYNEHDPIKVKPLIGAYNSMCHDNAVNYAKRRKGAKVVMGIYIDNSRAVLHFWNINSNGDHVETSIGYKAELFKYYYMRTIPEEGYGVIYDIFNDALEYFTNKFTTRFERFILGDTRLF